MPDPLRPRLRPPAGSVNLNRAHPAAWACLALAILTASGCTIGPNYKRPSAPVPAAYKEPAPAGWKEASPNDGAIRGKWWEMYNDPELNALEEQVAISNQNVLAAEAQYRAATYAVHAARAALYPTVSVTPSLTASRAAGGFVSGGQVNTGGAGRVNTVFNLGAGASWAPDLWGSIHRSVNASVAAAQASFAQLENARLAFQSELAQDYFQLHGTDGEIELLDRTVKSYEEYLTLTKNRFKAGVASGADVAQAQTQLDTTRAQLVELGVARAQFEHAIAILTGRPPLEVTVPARLLNLPPPPVSMAVPSVLLERRPDVAAAERQMAALNEQIGIAKSAFYPTLPLTAAGGFQSTHFLEWLTWPSRFWSVGGQFPEVVFEAGRRRAEVGLTEAQYDAAVASYRQVVLIAFQQVEDNLAALRIYTEEEVVIDSAVKAAEESLKIATDQYKAGTVAYLQVLVAQAEALANERSAVEILTRRLVSSVSLIQALGGGWDASTLPTADVLVHGQ